MIRIAIVDDEINVLKYISSRITETLNKFKYDAKIQTYTNGQEIIEADKIQNFDILFLDLEMPEPDGMQTAQIIRENNSNAVIAIITNRNDLVYKTLKYDISAFIRKELFEIEIEEELSRLYNKAKNRCTKYFLKTEKGERCFIPTEIVYIESNDHNVYLYSKSGEKIKIFYTLEKLTSILSDEIFVRCHSGIIVNCYHIFSINNDNIELTNNKLITLSRSRKKEVKIKFQKFMRSM